MSKIVYIAVFDGINSVVLAMEEDAVATYRAAPHPPLEQHETIVSARNSVTKHLRETRDHYNGAIRRVEATNARNIMTWIPMTAEEAA